MPATATRTNLIESLHAVTELLKRQARKSFKKYILYLKRDYDMQWFHAYIAERLQAFERGEIKKLMIFLPPQHGKSDLTSRLFPGYLLGKNPKRKIIISSYSSAVAHEFARDAKNYITSIEYQELFPKTKIGQHQEIDGSYSDSSYYYHTSPDKGFIYSVGRGGSITSKTIDIGIIDDPIKGKEEAMSLTLRDKLWQWYINDYRTRMHNASQELIIQTRWDKDDLAGRLLAKEDDWEVIKLPAVRTADYSAYDIRTEGEALWELKHSKERILDQKSKSEATFNSIYQQDPKPNSSVLIHPKFIAVKEFPMQSITRWVIGADYGYTNDPTAIVAIGIWGNKRFWRRLVYEKKSSGNREMVNVSAEDVKALLIQEGLDKCAIYSEHDDDMVSKLRRQQLAVQLANKSVYAGIQEVNKYENYYLEDDKITHDEIINYQFKTIGEMILNDPVDGNDHIMNAGRYAIYTDSYRPTA